MKTELKVKLIAHTPNPDMVVAKAAKLCYSKIGIDDMNVTEEEATKFVNRLASMGHESPIEHVNFTFAIEGVSRSLTHQLVRHRLASYSQQSQRYVKLSQFEYVIPPAIENNEIAKNEYIKAMEYDQLAYNRMYNILLVEHAEKNGIASKYGQYIVDICSNTNNPTEGMGLEEFWAKHDKDLPMKDRTYTKVQKKIIEDCRYVFPNACETKICVTMNARTLMNFFHHRCCDRAQWEIRELADEMNRLVREVAPAIFSKSGPSCVAGPCPEGSMSCGKVKEMRDKYLG